MRVFVHRFTDSVEWQVSENPDLKELAEEDPRKRMSPRRLTGNVESDVRPALYLPPAQRKVCDGTATRLEILRNAFAFCTPPPPLLSLFDRKLALGESLSRLELDADSLIDSSG